MKKSDTESAHKIRILDETLICSCGWVSRTATIGMKASDVRKATEAHIRSQVLTEDDIIPGMWLCKPCNNETFVPDGWYAKWTTMIGWRADLPDSGDDRRYCLISAADGMMGQPHTKKEILDIIKWDGLIRMPAKWLTKMMQWLCDHADWKSSN
jgi:hypothetical protein